MPAITESNPGPIVVPTRDDANPCPTCGDAWSDHDRVTCGENADRWIAKVAAADAARAAALVEPIPTSVRRYVYKGADGWKVRATRGASVGIFTTTEDGAREIQALYRRDDLTRDERQAAVSAIVRAGR